MPNWPQWEGLCRTAVSSCRRQYELILLYVGVMTSYRRAFCVRPYWALKPTFDRQVWRGLAHWTSCNFVGHPLSKSFGMWGQIPTSASICLILVIRQMQITSKIFQILLHTCQSCPMSHNSLEHTTELALCCFLLGHNASYKIEPVGVGSGASWLQKHWDSIFAADQSIVQL